MTLEEHKKRHLELHRRLDELVADFLSHHPYPSTKLPSTTTVMELMEWSHKQTLNPEDLPGEKPQDGKH